MEGLTPHSQPLNDSAKIYLGELSHLALRSFRSTEEVFHAVLMLISDQLGLRRSFLTHIDMRGQRNVVVAAYNQPHGCDIVVGADLPLQNTF